MTAAAARLDSQQVEIIGRQRLIESLLRFDFELAAPIRDRGIDLLVYDESASAAGTSRGFRAAAIQMKASSGTEFQIYRKFESRRGLIVCNVWNVHDPANVRVYAGLFTDLLRVADEMGYAETDSWKVNGGYSRRGIREGSKLHACMAPMLMDSRERWSKVIERAIHAASGK